MVPSNVVLFSCRFGTGDHRVTLAEFNLRDVARHKVNLCRPEIRGLIFERKLVVDKHRKKEIELLKFYNTKEILDELEKY